MNRIVQRNGAAPPWVDIQGGEPRPRLTCTCTATDTSLDLESDVYTFRQILRQSWIRRTLRMLSLAHPHPHLLAKLTLGNIKAHRDSEWVSKERAYHETAVANLNALVRKYNGLAPYAVRRSYYIREVEVERLYEDCAQEIMDGILEKCNRGFHNGQDLVQDTNSGGQRDAEDPDRTRLPESSLMEGIGIFRWLQATYRRLFGSRGPQA